MAEHDLYVVTVTDLLCLRRSSDRLAAATSRPSEQRRERSSACSSARHAPGGNCAGDVPWQDEQRYVAMIVESR